MERLIMLVLVLVGFGLLATPGIAIANGAPAGASWPIAVSGIVLLCFAPFITRKIVGRPKNPD